MLIGFQAKNVDSDRKYSSRDDSASFEPKLFQDDWIAVLAPLRLKRAEIRTRYQQRQTICVTLRHSREKQPCSTNVTAAAASPSMKGLPWSGSMGPHSTQPCSSYRYLNMAQSIWMSYIWFLICPVGFWPKRCFLSMASTSLPLAIPNFECWIHLSGVELEIHW